MIFKSSQFCLQILDSIEELTGEENATFQKASLEAFPGAGAGGRESLGTRFPSKKRSAPASIFSQRSRPGLRPRDALKGMQRRSRGK